MTAETRPLPRLDPLETHSGMALGARRSPLPPEQAIVSGDATVREALEQILIPALSRSPCLVAFSGGRDSSALLALAAHVARSQGLDPPIPVTHRFEEHPRADETEWQSLVIRHLGLEEWEIVEGSEHFDALGPNVRNALRRHGPYWPPNMHSLIPLLRAARGGTLITGSGGDEIFTPPRSRRNPSPWRTFRTGSVRRAAFYAALLVLPRPWAKRLSYRGTLRLPWLRPEARRRVRRRFLAPYGEADDRHPLERFHESRYLELSRAAGEAFASDAGSTLIHPFREPRFFGAWMQWAPPEGYPSRAAALEETFGDLLPRAATRRATKALFTEAAWGTDSREFAARWDGTGLDTDLVDPAALRRIWSGPRPDFRTVTPLHVAWIASQTTTSTHFHT